MGALLTSSEVELMETSYYKFVSFQTELLLTSSEVELMETISKVPAVSAIPLIF